MKKILLFGTIALSLNAYSQVPAYVPSNGLIGWWPFSGNSNDESGNGNNGVDNGPVLTADRFGSANNAYSFDGMDDLIAVGTEAIGPLGSADRAISFWARTSYSGSSMTPVDYGNFSAAGPSTFRIQIDNGFCPGISIDYSTLWTSNGINSLIDSNWHHYGCHLSQNSQRSCYFYFGNAFRIERYFTSHSGWSVTRPVQSRNSDGRCKTV